MTKAQAKKHADKMRNATGPNIKTMKKDAETDAQMIRETVAEAKRRGITTAQVLRERRGDAE